MFWLATKKKNKSLGISWIMRFYCWKESLYKEGSLELESVMSLVVLSVWLL